MNFDVKDGFLYLHDDTVPVHSRFEISMETTNTLMPKGKVFIADIDSKAGLDIILLVEEQCFFCQGSVIGENIRQLLNAITISIAKSIEGKWISTQKTIQLTISDSIWNKIL
jgi:hypothetical protein